jgi:hypothetical protein
VITNTARIKIEAVGNIFFDISDNNFTIATPTSFDFDNPGPATVACNGPVSASITLGSTVTGGFATPINLTASGNPAGTTVSFSPNPVNPGPPNTTQVTLNNTNTLSFGSYNITVTGTAGAIVKTRVLTYTIQAGAAPTINTQPTSQSACAGTNVTFSVAATGALTYQWQVSTPAVPAFTNIGGATSASLTLVAVTAFMNNNQYKCIVTGQCNTVTSNAATLTVFTAPTITANPQSVTLCVGSNNTFSVTANGTALTYQWQVSTPAVPAFTNIGGATSSTFTVNGVTIGMNTNQYKCVVSGTCAPPATSTAAVLTVIAPVTITTNPSNVTICETGNVSFTVVGNSTVPIIYQWQLSTNGGASFSNISGETAATLNLVSVTAGMNNNQYRCLLSNATCTTPTVSGAATLTVNARPTVSISASPYTSLFPGLTTTITATILPSAAGFNISWFRNGTLIPGVVGTTYVADVTTLGNYRVDIINPITGCNNQSSLLLIKDSASSRLFIFPSPNSGQFTVAYYNAGGNNTQQTITIYDSHGAKVYNGIFAVTSPYQLNSIDMRRALRGIYYVVLGNSSGKKTAEGKVLIH